MSIKICISNADLAFFLEVENSIPSIESFVVLKVLKMKCVLNLFPFQF